MPELDDPEGRKPSEGPMPKAPKEKEESACNHTEAGVDCPVHGRKQCPPRKTDPKKKKKTLPKTGTENTKNPPEARSFTAGGGGLG